MDKKSKILLIVLLLLAVVSIYLTYRRSFVTKNYEVVSPPTDDQATSENQ